MNARQSRGRRRRRGGITAAAACALGSLTLAAAGAQAAPIAVNTESDTVAADSHCSLREAIRAANNDMAPFAGPGECAAGAGADVVTLPAGHFTLTLSALFPEDANATGDLDVLGTGLTIRGEGAGSTTIDANRIDRVLDVRPARVAALERVTVTGGQAPNGANGGNESGAPGAQGRGGTGGGGEPGGGIRNAGTLTITDSTISDNRSGSGGDGGFGNGGDGTTGATGTDAAFGGGGGGLAASGGDGGGIFTSGPLTLTHVSLTGNAAGSGGDGGRGTGGQGGAGTSGDGGDGGGGRGGDGGRGGWGGGVAAASGAALTIDQSTISGNTAGDGGAGGPGQGGAGGVTSGDGTVGGNGGFGAGGAFEAGSGGFGGGIYAAESVTITRSLVTENRAGAGGRGGNGTGGLGGHAIDTGTNSATGGNGSSGEGFAAGDAGLGGGAFARGQYIDVTITANNVADGRDGGTGKGGNGGVSTGGPAGGHGGVARAGDGGNGGFGGGLFNGGGAIRHATVTANGRGTGGAAGQTIVGSGGAPGGTPGTASGALHGFTGGGGGIAGGSFVTLVDSVVAGNAVSNCGSTGGVVDGGHNFTFPDDSCPGAVADPQLGPLGDNGGPTRTQALLPGSPAIDVAPAGSDCPDTDQRGIVRPQGPACDSGAYEVEVSTSQPAPPGSGASGTGAPGSPAAQPSPDTASPGLLAASIRPATFAVDRRGAPETSVTARARKGTSFRFRLSENARVVFALERPQPGRRVKRRCVKPTRSNRRRPKCTRFVVVGRFAVTAPAGENAKKFSGRIGRRALKPGRYRATLTATDAAGNASVPKRLNFRVVRR